MSAAVQDPPLVLGSGHGGMPARRAVARWAWRLFRREWRQQSLVLVLLLVAVAATTVGLGVATNTGDTQAATFGTANRLITVTGDAAVAALRTAFGTVDVVEHQKIAVPGSANTVDLRAQDPQGPYGRSMLRLDSGRYPQGPDEIAVTDRVAATFGLHTGSVWEQAGHRRTVVGVVENPLNLFDHFALVAPGQTGSADHIVVLVRATEAQFAAARLPDGSSVELRSDATDSNSVTVLLLATIGLLFVGLLAAAGFTVVAQRRLRSLGMLGAIGAGRRHLRLVMIANGAVLGTTGALAGAAAGLAAWTVFSPVLEPLLGHRIDRFRLPWPLLAAAVLLAIVVAVGAAWWPARTVARTPVVAALSARPAAPRPSHRFAALGAVLLAGGAGCLVVAQQTRPPYIVAGVVATALGLLLLAPAGVAVLGRLAHLAPLAPRLALRDLARYRSRSSAALAAIVLATGIAAIVAISAAVNVAKAAVPTGGNLPAGDLVVWLAAEGASGPVPSLTTAQLGNARLCADAIAAGLQGSVVPLQLAVDPKAPQERGAMGGREAVLLGKPAPVEINGHTGVGYRDDESVPLYVATPQLLAQYGIDPAGIAPETDVLTSLDSLDGYDVIHVTSNRDWRPRTQHAALPAYTSLPSALITMHAVQTLHLTPTGAAWLVHTPGTLTQARIDRARRTAQTAGLSVESRPTGADQARLAGYFTGTGIAVALGVLATTVGLIRGETARDLRTLTAAGARRRTRRALTAVTAGSLALVGAVLGTTGAYLALLAWYHREPRWLTHVPLPHLAAIVLGLPALAYLGAWLLAGKEPPVLTRQPLD